MEQLIVHCRDDLLSEDAERRGSALLLIHEHLDRHQSDLGDGLHSLDYLFEFVVGKIEAEDCLDPAARIASLVLAICTPDQRKAYVDDLLSTLSSGLSSSARLCILGLLKGRIPDTDTLLRFVSLVQGEKNPQSLMAVFDVMETCRSVLGASGLEAVFEAFSVYFPITFKSSRVERSVSEEDLRDKLRRVLVLHPDMAHLALPFLNDKLSHAASPPIMLECIRALKHAFLNASESAVQAYCKESTNMLITNLVEVHNDDLTSATFDLIAHAFTESAVYNDHLLLVCTHLLHMLKDKSNPRLHSVVPSVIRSVAGPSDTATTTLCSSLLPAIKPAIESQPEEAKIEWACLLAMLCAQSESRCFAFRTAHPHFLLACVRTQRGCLQEEGCSQKDRLFASSFLEAVLRDPEALDSGPERMAAMVSVFDLVDSTKAFSKSLHNLIVRSIVKHQRLTLVGRASQLLRYTSPVLVKAFLSDPDLAAALVDEAVRNASPGTSSLLSHAQLESIEEQKRIQWIVSLSAREDEQCLDRLLCSLDPSSVVALLPQLGPTATRLAALALPVGWSAAHLLWQFKDDPEIKAALFSKHRVGVEELGVDSGRAQFCVLRAMLLQQDDRLFECLQVWSVEKSKLLSDSHTRVNPGHGFVCKPYHEQWFMEKALGRPQLFPVDCTIDLLTNCSLPTLQAIDLQPIFGAALTGPASCSVVRLLDMILECDACLLKSHCTAAIESLIAASVSADATAGHRHAALKCLASLLGMISGSAVLPFIPQFVKLLRPALGDKKSAVRALAVRCTDSLYSFYV